MPNAVSLASALVQNTLSKTQGINSLKQAGTDRTQPRHTFSPASRPKASLTTILVGAMLYTVYVYHMVSIIEMERIREKFSNVLHWQKEPIRNSYFVFAAVMELAQEEKCTIIL